MLPQPDRRAPICLSCVTEPRRLSLHSVRIVPMAGNEDRSRRTLFFFRCSGHRFGRNDLVFFGRWNVNDIYLLDLGCRFRVAVDWHAIGFVAGCDWKNDFSRSRQRCFLCGRCNCTQASQANDTKRDSPDHVARCAGAAKRRDQISPDYGASPFNGGTAGTRGSDLIVEVLTASYLSWIRFPTRFLFKYTDAPAALAVCVQLSRMSAVSAARYSV